ncbi:hypothetical protein K3495_g7022, partial [Podosphaera aphanis]
RVDKRYLLEGSLYAQVPDHGCNHSLRLVSAGYRKQSASKPSQNPPPNAPSTSVSVPATLPTFLPPNLWNLPYITHAKNLDKAVGINAARVSELFAQAPTSTTLQDTPRPPPRLPAPPMQLYDGQPSSLRSFCSQLINQFQGLEGRISEAEKVRYACQLLGSGALAKIRSSFRCLEDPLDPAVPTSDLTYKGRMDSDLNNKISNILAEIGKDTIFVDALGFEFFTGANDALRLKMLQSAVTCIFSRPVGTGKNILFQNLPKRPSNRIWASFCKKILAILEEHHSTLFDTLRKNSPLFAEFHDLWPACSGQITASILKLEGAVASQKKVQQILGVVSSGAV